MYPPVFTIAAQSPAVTAVLGSHPVRYYPFGKVPQNETRPYAVWQVVYGAPDNSLSCVPTEDSYGVQVDAYAKTATDAREVAAALRDAFEESFNHVVSWNGEFWESATGLYRVSFTAEFWTTRPGS